VHKLPGIGLLGIECLDDMLVREVSMDDDVDGLDDDVDSNVEEQDDFGEASGIVFGEGLKDAIG